LDNSRFLGGKPDALIDGYNIELSNKLTVTRRPGLLAYGVSSIPAPTFFFNWQQATLAGFVSKVDPSYATYPQGNLQLIIDTANAIYNYSPTEAGIIVPKANLSQQTSFFTVVNTMYMGDGVDLYKQVGVNLLTQSNAYSNAAWTTGDTTLTTAQTDPTGAANASYAVFSAASTASFIQQVVTPNYTPVASNTFTFSVWMKADAGTPTIYLEMKDSGANVMVNTQQTLSTSWTLYQVTGTAAAATTSVTVSINDPSSTSAKYYIYGAQLEVGGPATPTTITLNKPNGIYLWGIQAPTTAPTFQFTPQFGSTGAGWVPNHLYSSTTTASITAVAATASLAAPVIINGITYTVGAIYTATVTGGAANGLKGIYFSALPVGAGSLAVANQTLGTGNINGLPGFICVASDATTVTLYNTQATAQASLTGTNTLTLLDTIVDTNGNLEVAYTPGKSGGSAPIWDTVQGGPTPDGLQNVIVQYNSAQTNGAAGSIAFPATVTATNTVLVFVTTANALGSVATPTLTGATLVGPISTRATSNIGTFLYYLLSAAGTETGISFTGGGSLATWIGIVEISNQTAIDVHATNRSTGTTNILFSTGSVTTTNAIDVLISLAEANVANGTQGYSQLNIPTVPSGWQMLVSQAPTAAGTGFWNQDAAFTILSAIQSVNPTWLITNPTTNSNDGYSGVTAAFKSSVGTLVWYNLGPLGLTSLSAKGYQWGFSYVNTYTGQRSNISPLSVSSGNFAGQAVSVSGPGMQITPSGPYSADPQVDGIELYQNTDGGGFWYQVPPALLLASGVYINNVLQTALLKDAFGNQYIPNPGSTTSVGTWRVVDTVPDASLNTQIFAPIGFLNSPPPAGLTNLEDFSGRLWGSVGNVLYYATATDDAILLNVQQNGVGAESWEPTNFLTFNSQIVRLVATGIGLLVFTSTDVWIVAGTNLATYQYYKQLTNIGIGSYNAICVDGSNVIMMTRDRECLLFAVGQGASELGFVVGDFIEDNFSPMTAYLARHVAGSRDNAFYLGSGSSGFQDVGPERDWYYPADKPTGWMRLNPNQYGASTSGEQAPIWSPPGYIQGGCGAIASIEVKPGLKKLLVGGLTTGPVLVRDINTFSDNGTDFAWSGTIGSIMLALPSKLAVTESITTEMVAASSAQCGIGVLLDEISGVFETLPATYPTMTNDPPQLVASTSVLANRFYLSTGPLPPVCRHIQIKLTGATAHTKDELLALTIRGEVINEQ